MDFNQNNLYLSNNPYLLQHKKNPVNWQIWSNEVIEHAIKINKPLLLSIGYSTCHWCHVMEHESFEDFSVANFMNENFVCIKIDREERPDLDTLYMNVVQIINQSGGWPLNVFTMPDGTPFYGGTYFPKNQWLELLENIKNLYYYNKNKLNDFVKSISNGLYNLEKIVLKSDHNFTKETIDDTFNFWQQQIDYEWGGFTKTPKFILPNAWQTILRYAYTTKNNKLLEATSNSLDKISWGGIYDQIKGGFARYSVDPYWKIPHFEKMLYDNGQLLSLYANAYKVFNKQEYKTICLQTINWLKDEMSLENIGFYAAVDADSEGKEGKYYTWNSDQLKEILQEEYPLFKLFYNIDDFSLWEDDNNILMHTKNIKDFCSENNLSISDFLKRLTYWNKLLTNEREKRIKPSIDKKILTSWNALVIIGLCDVYQAINDKDSYNLAIRTIDFLIETQLKDDILYRNYKDKVSSTPGFLDDYALMIEALIKVYETSSTLKYLELAQTLTEIVFNNFYNYKNKMFSYKSHIDTPLINETFEIYDNVISSSNAIMANNLFKLGTFLLNKKYLNQSHQMLANIEDKLVNYPNSFACWINLYLNITYPYKEIVILGKQAKEYLQELNKKYIPDAIIMATENENYLEITQNRFIKDRTTIYLCKNNTCDLQIFNLNELINKI